jgi:nucleolar protein 6
LAWFPVLILQLGQLPFTCTTEDIQKHFANVQPNSIRHVTYKEGGKSKGYAFLEFDNWDRMRTCLKLYHHSEFDDGKSKPRKINIELTSGGGGNSDSRRGKIGSKNEKLEEERKRDYQKKKQEKSQGGGAGPGSSKAKDREKRPKSSKYEKRTHKSADGHVLTKKQKKMKAKQEKKRSRGALSKNETPKVAVEQMQKGNDYAGMDPSRAALMARQN